jgi:hypothetical protein
MAMMTDTAYVPFGEDSNASGAAGGETTGGVGAGTFGTGGGGKK